MDDKIIGTVNGQPVVGLGQKKEADPEKYKDGYKDGYEDAKRRDFPKYTHPSLGEKRVHLKFNPSEDASIYQVKKKCAELIDLLHSIQEESPQKSWEADRCFDIAKTNIESGQMWGVKGIAKKFK